MLWSAKPDVQSQQRDQPDRRRALRRRCLKSARPASESRRPGCCPGMRRHGQPGLGPLTVAGPPGPVRHRQSRRLVRDHRAYAGRVRTYRSFWSSAREPSSRLGYATASPGPSTAPTRSPCTTGAAAAATAGTMGVGRARAGTGAARTSMRRWSGAARSSGTTGGSLATCGCHPRRCARRSGRWYGR